MKILLIVSNSVSVLIVALYLFIDNQWQNVISQAVSGTGVTYGEMYGPLSFIKAIMEYAVLIVVILNAVISVLIVKHVNKSTEQITQVRPLHGLGRAYSARHLVQTLDAHLNSRRP